jgi:hypothetical protein
MASLGLLSSGFSDLLLLGGLGGTPQHLRA